MAATERENAGGACLNLSCVHMLTEESLGKVLLQIQVPDHPKVRLLTVGSSRKNAPLSENR